METKISSEINNNILNSTLTIDSNSNLDLQVRNSFERSILFYLDIDSLLKHFSSNNEFTTVLNRFKNMTADIFACHNFFDGLPKNCFLSELFEVLINSLRENINKQSDTNTNSSDNKNSQLNNNLEKILNSIKTFTNSKIDSNSYPIEEIYISFLILLYIFLQETIYGPSFFFIKETEKVDYRKDISKFNDHFLFKLEELVEKEFLGK